MTTTVRPTPAAVATKVPQVTALFWVVKVLTTGMGEAASDFLGGVDLVLAGAVGVVGFAVTLWLQFRTDRYRPAVYWAAVAMVAVFGTMVADVVHVVGVPYTVTTPLYAVALAVVFVAWWRREGTLSIHSITTRRFMPPDVVIMAPRRWAWLASSTDSQGRPLVVPEAGGFRAMAAPGENVAQGRVGSVLGMDVYMDPNIPTNLGAGTNRDVVLMFCRNDIWLWESELRAEAFTAPYADSLGVLFRVFNYAALIPDRYPASLGQIQGTGLVTPTFAS